MAYCEICAAQSTVFFSHDNDGMTEPHCSVQGAGVASVFLVILVCEDWSKQLALTQEGQPGRLTVLPWECYQSLPFCHGGVCGDFVCWDIQKIAWLSLTVRKSCSLDWMGGSKRCPAHLAKYTCEGMEALKDAQFAVSEV